VGLSAQRVLGSRRSASRWPFAQSIVGLLAHSVAGLPAGIVERPRRSSASTEMTGPAEVGVV